MTTPVTIIGGGLSGVLVAYRLTQAGINCKLLEANTRLGGRILSPTTTDNLTDDHDTTEPQPAIDLGPSWFWPGQNHIARLIKELELDEYVYSQASAGNAVMEHGDGSIVSGHGGASMAGSYRLSGGLHYLVQRLVDSIPADSLVTQAQVSRIQSEADSMVVAFSDGRQSIHSREVVLALPPRVVAKTIQFEPSLPEDYVPTLLSVPTWMAGQAKFVAVYETAFWREKGLSGDGFSQKGPLVEIHDASPKTGGPYALFGFVGVPASYRSGRSSQIKTEAVTQLTRMFGDSAAKPLSVHLKDWAFDPLTAIDLDRHNPRAHPSGMMDWMTVPGHDVVWAGTESALSLNHSNGYLEGAVEAGERAADTLLQRLSLPAQQSGLL